MKKLLLAAIALAVLSWVLCGGKSFSGEPAATKPAAKPAADPAKGLAVEPVKSPADLGPLPHPKPMLPPPKIKPPHPKPIGPKPKGYFKPYAGHPYHGGIHGKWAKAWVGHHHHGKHYLYGLYLPSWRGYTYRVWNERWLYWSPEDYCWYRYDPVLGVFIPLNPNGTDAIDTAPPPPPPPPPTPPPPPPPTKT
jgi:hypothetical protein